MSLIRIIPIIIFIFTWNNGFSQFQGGNGDGYSLNSSGKILMNTQTGYCTGGSGDGNSSGGTGLITLNSQTIYCTGVQGDGYDMTGSGSLTLNSQNVYCAGGNADGYAQNGNSAGILFNPAIFCAGGNGDGYHQNGSGILQINTQTNYCTGGNGDGHSQNGPALATLNTQNFYCTGGNADGHSNSLYSGILFTPAVFCTGGNGDGHSTKLYAGQLLNQSFYCTGGNADGYQHGPAPVTSFGTGIWKGTVSADWTIAGNWINGTVPDATMNVVIPGGCPNYPALSDALVVNSSGGIYHAQRLDILDGASVTNTGTLSIFGSMNVSGMYVANNANSASQNIQSGGNLTINGTGNVRIGNQSTGSGFCDLVVNSGGTLNVSGGFLDIDDQLNIQSGGTFNMTSGMVFAHRYGLGSLYSSSNPGSFYVASGSSGSISGGIIKVAGKTTLSSYTAVSINSSGFDFSGASSLVFTDGVNITGDNVEYRTVSGALLQNLEVDRPDRIVTIGSNAAINGNITIGPASTLKITGGKIVTIHGIIHL